MSKINIKKNLIEFTGDDYSINLKVDSDGISFSSGSIDYFKISKDSEITIGQEISISKNGLKYSNIDSGSFTKHNLISKSHVENIANTILNESLNKIKEYLQESFENGNIIQAPKDEIIIGNTKNIKSDSNLTFNGKKLNVTGSIAVDGNLNVTGNLNISSKKITNSNSNGNFGDINFDDNFLYVKTNQGWKRTPLSIF